MSYFSGILVTSPGFENSYILVNKNMQ